jgi:hypothetical protein
MKDDNDLESLCLDTMLAWHSVRKGERGRRRRREGGREGGKKPVCANPTPVMHSLQSSPLSHLNGQGRTSWKASSWAGTRTIIC